MAGSGWFFAIVEPRLSLSPSSFLSVSPREIEETSVLLSMPVFGRIPAESLVSSSRIPVVARGPLPRRRDEGLKTRADAPQRDI